MQTDENEIREQEVPVPIPSVRAPADGLGLVVGGDAWPRIVVQGAPGYPSRSTNRTRAVHTVGRCGSSALGGIDRTKHSFSPLQTRDSVRECDTHCNAKLRVWNRCGPPISVLP